MKKGGVEGESRSRRDERGGEEEEKRSDLLDVGNAHVIPSPSR